MFTRKKQKKQTRNPYKKIRKSKPRYKTRKQHGTGFRKWFGLSPQQDPDLEKKRKIDIENKDLSKNSSSTPITYMLIRHAFSCNNLLKEQNPLTKFLKQDDDPSLTLYGIKSLLAIEREIENFKGTVFVSPLIRTWQSAILEFYKKIKEDQALTLIVSPFIKEKGSDGENMPLPMEAQISKMNLFIKLIKENLSLTLPTIYVITPLPGPHLASNGGLNHETIKIILNKNDAPAETPEDRSARLQRKWEDQVALHKMSGGDCTTVDNYINEVNVNGVKSVPIAYDETGPYVQYANITNIQTDIFTYYYGENALAYFNKWYRMHYGEPIVFVVCHSNLMQKIITTIAPTHFKLEDSPFNHNSWAFTIINQNDEFKTLTIFNGIKKPSNSKSMCNSLEPLCFRPTTRLPANDSQINVTQTFKDDKYVRDIDKRNAILQTKKIQEREYEIERKIQERKYEIERKKFDDKTNKFQLLASSPVLQTYGVGAEESKEESQYEIETRKKFDVSPVLQTYGAEESKMDESRVEPRVEPQLASVLPTPELSKPSISELTQVCTVAPIDYASSTKYTTTSKTVATFEILSYLYGGSINPFKGPINFTKLKFEMITAVDSGNEDTIIMALTHHANLIQNHYVAMGYIVPSSVIKVLSSNSNVNNKLYLLGTSTEELISINDKIHNFLIKNKRIYDYVFATLLKHSNALYYHSLDNTYKTLLDLTLETFLALVPYNSDANDKLQEEKGKLIDIQMQEYSPEQDKEYDEQTVIHAKILAKTMEIDSVLRKKYTNDHEAEIIFSLRFMANLIKCGARFSTLTDASTIKEKIIKTYTVDDPTIKTPISYLKNKIEHLYELGDYIYNADLVAYLFKTLTEPSFIQGGNKKYKQTKKRNAFS